MVLYSRCRVGMGHLLNRTQEEVYHQNICYNTQGYSHKILVQRQQTIRQRNTKKGSYGSNGYNSYNSFQHKSCQCCCANIPTCPAPSQATPLPLEISAGVLSTGGCSSNAQCYSLCATDISTSCTTTGFELFGGVAFCVFDAAAGQTGTCYCCCGVGSDNK